MSFFGPMSKKRILKGIDEQISNRRYLLTDTVLSREPLYNKDAMIESLKTEIAQMRQLRDSLEPLLE
jgi:hypothetical protein